MNKVYSICITTYKYRFEKWLVPLIDSIKEFKPDIEILIAVNGENNQTFDESFRRNILEYTAVKKNTFVTIYPTYRGLCKLWNNLLINSSNHNVLLLNDDITITNIDFFNQLEKAISTNDELFKINNSWSHVFVDRRLVDKVGWFDERYLSIGEEDGDFEWRYGKCMEGQRVPTVLIPNIINQTDHTNCLVGMPKVNSKYSKFNLDFAFGQKYEINNKTGENYGVMNRHLVCKSPTPILHATESFYWCNKSKLNA